MGPWGEESKFFRSCEKYTYYRWILNDGIWLNQVRLKKGRKNAVSDVGHNHFINISALNTSLKDLMVIKKNYEAH